MRDTYKLTPTRTSQSVNLNNFRAASCFIENPTGSPLLLRVGGNDIPTLTNADHRVPAGGYLLVPVDGASFGIGLADPSAVTSSATSNLMTTATVMFLSADEELPQFGSASFQSLSLADLTGGMVPFVAPNTTSATFDLGSWGGALVYILPTAGSGQGVASVQASADGASWSNVQRVAFWPDVPLTINVARVARYLRLVVNATAIPGEPAIAGVYSVRASIEEIQQTTFSAAAGQLQKAFSIASLGTGTYYFCTVGLMAVSLRAVFSSGSRGELVWYTSNVVGNWAQVAYREQSVSGFYNSVFRSLGNLDSFLRIDVLEIANAGPMNGTLSLTIQAEPDLTGMLQQVFGALGDTGQPVNANQSIYHELDTMRGLDVTRNASLSAIANNTLNSSVSLGSIDGKATTGNTNTAQTATNVALIRTDAKSFATILRFAGSVAIGGAYQLVNATFFSGVQSGYILKAFVSYSYTGATGIGDPLRLTLGSAGSPVVDFFAIFLPETATFSKEAIPWEYDSVIAGGIPIGGFPALWCYHQAPPLNIELTLIVRGP